ncbi:MAG: hypothetical protein WCR51_02380 [Planctomycetia bacterium]
MTLRENVQPSPITSLTSGPIVIRGATTAADGATILVRVTTSAGDEHVARAAAAAGRFECRYPTDFPGANPRPPLTLYVDATTAPAFGSGDPLTDQAEMMLVVAGSDHAERPDLPLVFTDDFLDATGRKDREAASWPRQQALVNLFIRSRAAKLMHIGRTDFDLDREADYRWFQNRASLYDFDHRDRDWSQPLGHRVSRGFWQAMWNTWFNATNDHPWDGNPANTSQENFRPYTFANDAADLLILYQMLGTAKPIVQDNRTALREDVLANLLAMQHRTPDNFALREASGKQLHYTAGAFRYGMFETGEFLTEGTGWFANPTFRDFDYGGVLNGRCIWALGESLAADPQGPHAAAIRAAIPLTLQFCLRDALDHGYARRTRGGRVLWGYPGEHGYLLLGMLAAAKVAPDLPIPIGPAGAGQPLRDVCIEALHALVDATKPDGTWSHYGNVDAVNISALSAGACEFPDHPDRDRWVQAAVASADVWLTLKPLPAERTAPTPLFGLRRDGGMTYYLGDHGLPHFALYLNGHWIEALARLFAITGDVRHRDRARAILAYYCGDNPLHVRLLSEIGSVNNRVTDRDKDGAEDQLGWDAYPESTAFVQIGLLQLLEAEASTPVRP